MWCLPAEGKRGKSAGFGQAEREQQAVCQLEYDGDIQNPNSAEMTVKASADGKCLTFCELEIIQIIGYMVGCEIYILLCVIAST